MGELNIDIEKEPKSTGLCEWPVPDAIEAVCGYKVGKRTLCFMILQGSCQFANLNTKGSAGMA